MFANKSRSCSPAARRDEPPKPTSRPVSIPERRKDAGSGSPSPTPADETAPLLAQANGHTVYGTTEARAALEAQHRPPGPFSRKAFLGRTAARAKHVARTLTSKNTYVDLTKDAASSFPAVILGLLLNVLDGVSYGFIMFPTGAIFSGALSSLMLNPALTELGFQASVESESPCSSLLLSLLNLSILWEEACSLVRMGA